MLCAIRELLSSEDLIYVADTRYAPYGELDAEFVAARSGAIAEFLARTGVKAMVVACNTATAIAVKELRARYDIPIVGIEPGIKPAVARSQSKRIVVLATQRTIESEAVEDLQQRFGADARITLLACPQLVEQVEQGELESDATISLLKTYARSVSEAQADVIVLGCTHFAFLERQIRRLTGTQTVIIEPSRAVARQLAARLQDAGLLVQTQVTGREQFFTTSTEPGEVAATMSTLLGRRVTVLQMNDTN